MSNKTEKFKQRLKDYLLRRPLAHPASGGQWIVFRCPFCGDSKKHATKTRFYVKVEFADNEKPIYYCHNCNITGYVDENLFRELNIEDSDLEFMSKSHNSGARNNIKSSSDNKYIKRRNVKLLAPLNNKNTLAKIEYLNKRLGIQLSVRDIVDLKIILNFYDFMKYNNIKFLNDKTNKCDAFDDRYVGFLSYDNNYITLRNVGEYNDYYKRYEIYNIFNEHDNTKKYYIIPNKIDIMQDVEIILAEGIFDILSIYYNIYDGDKTNRLFCACCGAGFYSVITSLLRMGLIHSNIHIYADQDKPLKEYQEYKKRLNKFKGEMSVSYNVYTDDKGLRKDFGVPGKEIKAKTYTI